MARAEPLGPHCVHIHPSPGCFVCCQCKRRTHMLPGSTRSTLKKLACIPKRGAWFRHLTGWGLG